MARQQEQLDGDPAVAAIERVLKVERDGVEQLRWGQERARNLQAHARDRAAAIGRRTDTCIANLHNRYLQKVQRDIEQLAQSHPSSAAHGRDGYDDDALRAAARRLAAKLTGGA